jgi:hypothetical protein
MDNKRIVVIAGNREQFKYWLRNNIIPITGNYDLDRLRGIRVREIVKYGTWYDWVTPKVEYTLNQIKMLNILTAR